MSSSWVVKVERARELLDELRGDIASFVDERPFTLTERTRDNVVQYELHVLTSPPQRLSVIAGEIAHDLRSALDHLVWHCVEANGSTPNRDTAFPIQRVADDDGFARQTKGLSTAVVEVVRSVQPHKKQTPEHDPLLRLHDFNRFDKHRLLHVAVIAMEQVLLTIGGRQGTGQVRLPWDSRWGWPIFDGVLGGQAIAFDEATRELVVYIPAPDRMIRLRLPLVRQRVGQLIRFSAPRPRRVEDATLEVYPEVRLDVLFSEEGGEVGVTEALASFVEATQGVITKVEAAGG